MKQINLKLTIAIFIAALLFITSCKKESNPAPKTTLEKILGKWSHKTSVFNYFYSGMPHVITITGTAADYADFRTDGKVYSYITGAYDTVSYSIISDVKMWIDDPTQVYDIQTLTDKDLKIYNKESYPGGDYDESTLTFFR